MPLLMPLTRHNQTLIMYLAGISIASIYVRTYDASMHPPPYLLLIDPWQGKKEMLMTLVKHPRNSHPEMDSPFKIPSKYAPDEGRIGSFFWDGARSSPYFTHNALGQKMLNAFLVCS